MLATVMRKINSRAFKYSTQNDLRKEPKLASLISLHLTLELIQAASRQIEMISAAAQPKASRICRLDCRLRIAIAVWQWIIVA
jgi:hypothetical protein